MTVINTNVKALYTQSALKQAERASETAMQQLSTGKRINSSKDDAAGLAIAARMTQNIKGMNQSIRNAGDAISLIQVAEGATNEITAMLQRMSELAVQSSNSTYSTEQRGYLDQEFQQLKQEIVRISETHEWNGFPILNGKAGTPVGYPNVTTDSRPAVKADETGLSLKADDLVIEVLKADGSKVPAKIPASLASDDTLSSEVSMSSNKAGSAIAIAAAINKVVGTTGVRATAVGAQINATKTVVGATSIQTDLYVNGTKISLSLTAGQTVGERRRCPADAVAACRARVRNKHSPAAPGLVESRAQGARELCVCARALCEPRRRRPANPRHSCDIAIGHVNVADAKVARVRNVHCGCARRVGAGDALWQP
jgi:flagellin